MGDEYPQLGMGTTLVDVCDEGERRRVYALVHPSYVEVGEFTCGALTEQAYEAPAHVHSVQLPATSDLDAIERYFSEGEPLLADYMDLLDAQGVSYGYLNSHPGKYVAYRPMVVGHNAGNDISQL